MLLRHNLKWSTLLGYFYIAQIVNVATGQGEVGEPLFLTPLIEAGSIEEGRTLCRVQGLPSHVDSGVTTRESCAGFITVNSTYNSNIFVWFFPALNNPETAPLIVWLDGGPGVSGMFSLFTSQGPYAVNSDGKLEDRELTWTANYSMLFLDNPIGSGFSFTEDGQGYATSSEESAQQVAELLKQFFLLFDEYRGNPFYIGGISYGGHFGPPLATLIHQRNQDNSDQRINLTGLLMYVPWTHPIAIVEAGSNFYYQVGLIDAHNLTYFQEQEVKVKELIQQQQFVQAKDMWSKIIGAPNSTFISVTGFSSAFNLVEDTLDFSGYYFTFYVESSAFRQAVHVGNLTFNLTSPIAAEALNSDFMQSVATDVEELLNSTTSDDKKYKVLIVSGQLDLSVTHKGIETMVEGLQWNGTQEFKEARRTTWKIGGTVAGYIKQARNLTYALIRNAGHMVISDQPKWNLDLLDGFISGEL